jgi:hypothetical protein
LDQRLGAGRESAKRATFIAAAESIYHCSVPAARYFITRKLAGLIRRPDPPA